MKSRYTLIAATLAGLGLFAASAEAHHHPRGIYIYLPAPPLVRVVRPVRPLRHIVHHHDRWCRNHEHRYRRPVRRSYSHDDWAWDDRAWGDDVWEDDE